MSFHQKLKEATRALHEETEQQLFPGQSWQALSLDDYRQFLQVQYVFHTSIENAVTPALSSALREQLQWAQRQKQLLLIGDLEEANSALPSLLPFRISLQSEAEILGTLYVTEGSTLGGRMICKALKKNKQIAPYTSFQFLEGYGAETGSFWKDFLQILEQKVQPNAERSAIEAAKQAFGVFNKSASFIKQQTLNQKSLHNSI